MQGNVTSEVLRLLDELEVSFGHLPTPPSHRIVVDNNDLECQQIRAKLGGRHWRDLTIDDLAGESDALSFLTPEAFRFYLPAFIRVSLTDPFRADLIPDAILSALGIPEDPVVRRERERELTRRVAKTGLPGKVLKDLLEEREPAWNEELEAFREARREMLSPSQGRAVLDFVGFLRKHRPEEFDEDELRRVEEALGDVEHDSGTSGRAGSSRG